MEGVFAAAVVVVAAVLYLPGALVFRALRFDLVDALALAPVLAITVCALAGIAYSAAGIGCTWATVSIPLAGAALAGAVALGVRRVRGAHAGAPVPSAGGTVRGGRRGMRRCEAGESEPGAPGRLPLASRFDALCLVLYLGCGIALASVFFLGTLGGASSYVQEYDNLHHLGSIRAFLESGSWNSLADTLYPLPAEAAVDPLPTRSFYPGGWTCLAAFAANATGASVAVAENAVNFALVALVFPVSALAFLRTALPGERPALALGALCPLAFTAFPWGFLIFGPLYPNLLAFAVLPAVAGCLVRLLDLDAVAGRRAREGAGLALGFVALALTQPNAVFSLGVLLVPYLVMRASQMPRLLARGRAVRQWTGLAAGAAAVLVIAAVWFACFSLPFLASVVWYDWPAFLGASEALENIVSLAFRIDVPQWWLAAFTAAGIGYTLWRRRYRWLSVSFVLVCAIYFVDVTQNGFVKHLVAGFWYTDSTRIAALAAIAALPLAALGLQAVYRVLVRVLAVARAAVAKLRGREGGAAHSVGRRSSAASLLRGAAIPRPARALVGAAVALAFAVPVLWPFGPQNPYAPERSAMGAAAGSLLEMNDLEGARVYGAEEQRFVREVRGMLPPGAMVINFPDDGSAFAYAEDGLNAYYRYTWGYGGASETPESVAIRTGLSRIASDDKVREAVRRVGARYVLLLDHKAAPEDERWLFSYHQRGDTWRGIEAIDDDTPGFSVVAARDDMRLYRIEGV